MLELHGKLSWLLMDVNSLDLVDNTFDLPQAKHKWYGWGTYTCGGEILEADISIGTIKNAQPTGVPGSLYQAPLKPIGLASTDIESVGWFMMP